MTEKIILEPKKFSDCPGDCEIVLDFYKGYFDSVYVLLHPFFKPGTIDRKLFRPATWPSKHQIISGCTAISWQTVLEKTGMASISEVDVGLKTVIGGLKQEYRNQTLANTLNKLTDENDIIQPQEGDLPPLLENRLFSAIQSLGYQRLWLGDEFGDERKLHWIEDLKDKDEIPSHGNVFTHDHKILIKTHWDSHYSFLCSSKETIERLLSYEKFEGFYCSSDTEVFWSTSETNLILNR